MLLFVCLNTSVVVYMTTDILCHSLSTSTSLINTGGILDYIFTNYTFQLFCYLDQSRLIWTQASIMAYIFATLRIILLIAAVKLTVYQTGFSGSCRSQLSQFILCIVYLTELNN